MKNRMLQLGMWSLSCFLIGAWSIEADAANTPAGASKPAVSKKTPARKTAVKTTVRKKAHTKTTAKSKTKSRKTYRPVTRPVTNQELEHQKQIVESVNAVSKPEQMTRLWASAQTFLNVPYKLGANTLQATDCSGYTSTVYRDLGVELPRTAHQQFLVGAAVEKEELTLGDLVFFGTSKRVATHVGMYIGDGKFMHASTGARRVRIDNLTPMFGNRRYLGAKRFINEPQAGSGSDGPLIEIITEAVDVTSDTPPTPLEQK